MGYAIPVKDGGCNTVELFLADAAAWALLLTFRLNTGDNPQLRLVHCSTTPSFTKLFNAFKKMASFQRIVVVVVR